MCGTLEGLLFYRSRSTLLLLGRRSRLNDLQQRKQLRNLPAVFSQQRMLLPPKRLLSQHRVEADEAGVRRREQTSPTKKHRVEVVVPCLRLVAGSCPPTRRPRVSTDEQPTRGAIRPASRLGSAKWRRKTQRFKPRCERTWPRCGPCSRLRLMEQHQALEGSPTHCSATPLECHRPEPRLKLMCGHC